MNARSIKYCFLLAGLFCLILFAPLSRADDLPIFEASPMASDTPRANASHGHEFWLVSHQELGVASSLLLNYFGRFDLGARVDLLVGGGLSLFQNWGPALLGITADLKFDEISSHFYFGTQHERWPDWGVTENRAVAYWEFRPLSTVSLTLGYSYRAPQFNGMGIQSFTWVSSTAEWGPLYRFQWRFFGSPLLESGALGASVLIWNYDRMRLETADNIHFSIIPEYRVAPTVSIQGMATTAVKGFSGAVVSWDQVNLALGLKYDL